MNLPTTDKELELYFKLHWLAILHGRTHVTFTPEQLSVDPDEIKYQKVKEEYFKLVKQTLRDPTSLP